MNTVLVEAIGKGLGTEPKRDTNGSEKFAGDSPDQFGAEWEENMKVFDQIDPEMWK
jgi:hypothetical protein